MNQLLKDQLQMLRESRKYLLCILMIVITCALFGFGLTKVDSFNDFMQLFGQTLYWVSFIILSYYGINQVEKKFWQKEPVEITNPSNQTS